MPIDCIAPKPLGSNSCETTTGIADAWYTTPSNIAALTYNQSLSGFCSESEVASFTLNLDLTAPIIDAERLLQPINFVNQDDDSGAVYEIELLSESGNKIRNVSFTFQVEANHHEDECAIDGMVNKEIAIAVKYKDGRTRLVNHTGGMKVTSVTKNSNTSYYTITLSGRPNDRPLLVDASWVAANIIPNSINPTIGLVNE